MFGIMLTSLIKRLALGLIFLAAIQAAPALANTCAPATGKGTAPNDYQDYCWLDFTGYSDATAQAAGGQPFTFALPDGSTLSLTLQVTTNKTNPALVAHVVPSWTGSAIGNRAFTGIPGAPVMYETVSGSTVHLVLSNISVVPPSGGGATASYAMIAADGESTNQTEQLIFTTNGQAWSQVAQIANGTAYPAVSGVGTTTVTETGVAGTVGGFAFASFNNPTQISTTLVGGGLQGAIFAIRYASLAANAQFSGARASASDQFTYSISTTGGQTIASASTTGTGSGPFIPAAAPTIAASYPFVVSETLAAGSASTLANYAVSLTCTNGATGTSSTALPTNLAARTYTFTSLQYGDAVSCVFTNTANRANLAVAKTGPTSVSAGAPVSYNLAVSNAGPADASGATVKDPAVANFTASGVTCAAATGGAVCPTTGVSIANLQGAGIVIPTLPSGSALTFAVSGTAGSGNIVNIASITPPSTVVNSNTTPSSSATTTVTPPPDAISAAAFPVNVAAGQPVNGTVTYSNGGSGIANNTTFGITLAPNLTAPTLTGLPAGATYAYAPGSGVVTLSGMPTTLAAGASIGPIGVHYTQPSAASSTVSATVTTTADSNPANNTVTVVVGGPPDASSSVAFPASIYPGQPVSGTVTYSNGGTGIATNTTFGITVPANLGTAPTLTGLPAGATYSYAAGTGVITLSGMPTSMAVGASIGPIGVNYLQPATGTSTVVAVVGTTGDSNLSNNTATASIGGGPPDALSSATFPATVNPGLTVNGTVTFSNAGLGVATNTTFGITLPANLGVAPTLTGLPAGATYSYAAGTGAITFTGMPTTIAVGTPLGPIGVHYLQPSSGTSSVTAVVTDTGDSNTTNNSVTVVIGGGAPDAKSVAVFPATVNPGQTVSGTVTFSNIGLGVAANTTFGITLPANLATAPTLSGLPVGVTYVYAPGSGVITLTGMPTSLVAGGSIGPIGVSYLQPASGSSTVIAVVAATGDSNPSNNTATAMIGGGPPDALTSVAFPTSVAPGQPVNGTVRYSNAGLGIAANTTFAITLPANLASAPTLTGLPTGATYAYAPGTGAITFTGMPTSIAVGTVVGPIGVHYVQPSSGTSSVTAVVADTGDSNAANNSATVVIGGGAPDVSSTAAFPANVNAGQTVSGTLTFANSGPGIATNTSYAITLPAGLSTPPTLTGLPAGVTYSYAPGTGIVTLSGMPATIAVGAAIGPIAVSYVQPASASSTVTATVTASGDSNPNNNKASAVIGGAQVADLGAKVTFPATANAGQPVSGSVTLTNAGPSSAAGVHYTITVPANLAVPPTFTGLPSGVTTSYDAATGVITFTGLPATLASGASVGPLGVTFAQPASGSSTVSATVGATTLDPKTGNNTVTATITGTAAQLTGVVFVDTNRNGAYDAGDTPIAGTTVQLFSGTRLVASTITAANGSYSFAGQPAGAYSVVVAPLPGNASDTPSPQKVTLGGTAVIVANFGQIHAGASGSLVLTKSTPLVNISAGQSVPYSITAANATQGAIVNATVTDLMPAGFHFRSGSGSINGQKQDPTLSGRTLSWARLSFAAGEKKTFTLVLTAGAGVVGGDYVNQSTAFNGATSAAISNTAAATVRVVGDPTFDCPDLVGKVFDDSNANGIDDPGEKGIAGVRLVTAQGLLITTDAQGRYHIVCPLTPDASIGSNFILKLDERTLPSGYRLTTDNPETVRLTAGKVSKLNFGATIHHVVRIEVSDSGFEGNQLRAEIAARIDALIASMHEQSFVVRLAYAAGQESDSTIALRMQALRSKLNAAWKSHDMQQPLRIEEDIVRGATP
jgi:large repetitive protein